MLESTSPEFKPVKVVGDPTLSFERSTLTVTVLELP